MFRRIALFSVLLFAAVGMLTVHAQCPVVTYQKFSYLSQTADISNMTVFSCSAAAAQDFRVSAYVTGTTFGTLTLKWTDEFGNQSFGASTPSGYEWIIHCTAGSAVKISVAGTGGTYDLWMTALGG